MISLTIDDLIDKCRNETQRYLRTGQSNETFCFELFHRALVERDEAAWHAVYSVFQGHVRSWIHKHGGAYLDDDPEDFVNEAFARLWQYGGRPETARQLDSLGKCLRYLELCAVSAIQDFQRRRAKDALSKATSFEDMQVADDSTNSPKDQVERDDAWAVLRHALEETLQDDRERLVVEESWIYDRAPRQIQARYPQLFATVAHVSQIKRNILKRLQRKLTRED